MTVPLSGPEREWVRLSERIAALGAEVDLLRARREPLRRILAGPRVTVVLTTVTYGEVEEIEFDDLDTALRAAWDLLVSGGCSVRSVTVGGVVLGYDDFLEAGSR